MCSKQDGLRAMVQILQEWINVYEVDEDLLLPMFGVIKQILNCV
jgi:hypothetical protein